MKLKQYQAENKHGKISLKQMQLCPKCEHLKAYFKEIQIRTVDVSSTIFYKCVNCGLNREEDIIIYYLK